MTSITSCEHLEGFPAHSHVELMYMHDKVSLSEDYGFLNKLNGVFSKLVRCDLDFHTITF